MKKNNRTTTIVTMKLKLAIISIFALPNGVHSSFVMRAQRGFNIFPAMKMSSTTEESSSGTTLVGSAESAISMNIVELENLMGGSGKAKITWDFMRLGIDPQLFFDEDSKKILDDDARSEILKLLPSKRQTQGLGKGSLELLKEINPEGGVEMGLATLTNIHTSSDGTTKLLLKLRDGLDIETVIIPWDDRKRSTLCISSQVGCRQGCTFCATGRMGRLRNLSQDEILVQMFYANKICRLSNIYAIDNIVFMGMGEPADNAGAVKKAAEILTDRQLFQIAQSKVTVSTVAPNPESFMLFDDAPCVLAWSVHAATDELRKKLVPTTKYTMSELREGLIRALLKKPKSLQTTMLEYVLINEVNDSEDDAEAMAQFAKGIIDAVPGSKVMINLIMFNDIGHPTYTRPKMENALKFQAKILNAGVKAYIRTTRGDDESAACGQLATKNKSWM